MFIASKLSDGVRRRSFVQYFLIIYDDIYIKMKITRI